MKKENGRILPCEGFDSGDAEKNVSMLENVSGKLYDGQVALTALIQDLYPKI